MNIEHIITMLKQLIVILGIVMASFAYLYLSSSDGIVVSENGEITGFLNEGREVLQGRKFWIQQLAEIDAEIAEKIERPAHLVMAKVDQELAVNLERSMEGYYRKYPEARPSPAEAEARALRRRADEIEHAELLRLIAQHEEQRLAELRRVRSYVEQVLSSRYVE